MLRRLLAFTDANAPSNAPYLYDTRLSGDPPPLMATNTAFRISAVEYDADAQSVSIQSGDGSPPRLLFYILPLR